MATKNIQIALNNIDKAELAVYEFENNDKNLYRNGEVRDELLPKFKKLQNKASKLYDELVEYCKSNNITLEILNEKYTMPETVSAYFNDCVYW